MIFFFLQIYILTVIILKFERGNVYVLWDPAKAVFFDALEQKVTNHKTQKCSLGPGHWTLCFPACPQPLLYTQNISALLEQEGISGLYTPPSQAWEVHCLSHTWLFHCVVYIPSPILEAAKPVSSSFKLIRTQRTMATKM